jgi:hypothetical protein
MFRGWKAHFVLAAMAALAVFWSAVAEAGLTDRLKKKVQDKAAEKTNRAADAAVDGAADRAPGEGEAGDEAGAATSESSEAAGEPDGDVSSVSTKFDYVPGDKVLFADDFTQDELGEFPARWKLSIGTFEVAEMKGERWLRCTSVDGTVMMKLPAAAALPEFWTLEFDFFAEEPMGNALTVRGLGANGSAAWSATFPQGSEMAFRCGDIFSSTPFEGRVPGRHHVMLMARGPALKIYIDRQRMVNVPDISGPVGMPATLDIRLWAPTHPMITNVRFAEGCRPAKDLLAEGKLVTYGIHFASGSDVVKPESAPVLRQIASYLDSNAQVKLRITGHTDNTGNAPGNLDLSKRRAASVARVLAEEFKIASERFATDGKGDAEAVAPNATAEGRAMNRRVEFTKL